MKMTLMEAVQAHTAAEEMGRQALPYDLALALVKVKQATAAEMETFLEEERKLVERYAEKDEDGNMRMVEREARIVRQIYSMFLDGQTPSSIAAYLIRCGIPTPAVAGK